MNQTELEQNLLGSVMLAAKEGRIDYYDTIIPLLDGQITQLNHKPIFAAINTLYQKNTPADPMAVSDLIPDANSAYILGLVMATTIANTDSGKYYLAKLIDQNNLTRLRKIGFELIEALDKGTTASEMINAIQDTLSNITNPANEIRLHCLPDIIIDVMTMTQEASKPGHIAGIKTGLPYLDRFITGLKPGEVTILAGRPRSGKSSLAVNLATNICIKGQAPGLFISLEMSRHALIQKVLGAYPGLTISKIIQGDMTETEWSNYSNACNTATTGKLFITDQSIDYYQLEKVIKNAVTQHKIKIAFIDHLHLLTTNKKDQREIETLSEITASVKRLARFVNIPIILLAQLNRGVEHRAGMPRLSDLRGSGTIEQDADNVIFIHRPDDPEMEGVLINDGYFIISKQRMGETGFIKITFRPEQCQFYENSWADPNCREAQGTSRVSRKTAKRDSKDFITKD